MVDLHESKPHLSASGLGQYLTCGRRGDYHYDPTIPRGGSNANLGKGSAYHHVLEAFGLARLYYGDNVWNGEDFFERAYAVGVGYLTEIVMRDDFYWGEKDTIEDMHQHLWNMLSMWASDPSYQWRGDGVGIMGVEVAVKADFGSEHHSFLGFIDGVYNVPDVGVVGTDFKTAGRAWGGAKAAGDPRKALQAPLYAEAWYQQTGTEMAGFTYDVMTQAGKFQRVWVDVSPAKRKPFIDRWVNMSNTIHLHHEAGLLMPTNPDSMLCSEKFCDYWTICPMGAELDGTKG